MKTRTSNTRIISTDASSLPEVSVAVEKIDLAKYNAEINNVKPSSSKFSVPDKIDSPEVVDLTDSAPDPTVIISLVKDHCIFCLKRKTATIFRISDAHCLEETDGYDLICRYFGNGTADSLNDIFDAMVFNNKGLITAEFPAPLLCENCVKIMKDLDHLHKQLETVQRQVLHRIKHVRKLIIENESSIKKDKGPSLNRLQFEGDLVEDFKGCEERTEAALNVLDKFQEALKEDTHDPIEIHLEHLEQARSFYEDESIMVTDSVKETACASTQTHDIIYDVKVVKLSVEEDDNDPAPASPLSSYDDVAMECEGGINNDDHEFPGPDSPQEIPAMDFDDIKPVTGQVPAPTAAPEVISQQSPSPEVNKTHLVRSSTQKNGVVVPETVTQAGNGITIVRGGATSGIQIVKNRNANPPPHVDANTTKSDDQSDSEEEEEEESEEDESGEGEEEESESGSNEEESESDSDSDESESEDEEDIKEDPTTMQQSKTNKGNIRVSSPTKGRYRKPQYFKCVVCKSLFTRLYDVQRHIRQFHNAEPSNDNPLVSYTCFNCHIDFEDLSKLRDHMKGDHGIKVSRQSNRRTYQCDICGYARDGLRLVGFIDHLLEHENQRKTFSCDDCLQKFTTKQMYQVHPCPQTGRIPGTVTVTIDKFENLRKETDYRCRFCSDAKFYSERTLIKHFEDEHKESKAFLCDICNDEASTAFRSKNCLKTHMIEVHSAVKYKCRICEKGEAEFKRYDDFYIHLNFKHFGGYFNCPECSQKFSSRSRLDEHMACHTEEKMFVCITCDKGLKTRKGLQLHIEKFHQLEPTSEQIDDDAMDGPGPTQTKVPRLTKAHLVTQRLRKNGEQKPFMCTLCDYCCCTAKLYRRHMQVNHGILVERKLNTRTYQCDICGFNNSTMRLSGFVQHLLEHESPNIKKFCCEDCMGVFTTKQMYQFHRCPQTGKLPGTATVHTEGHDKREKEHPCRVCGEVSLCEKKLQKHCREVHGENAFACEFCGPCVAFISRDNLKSHLITSHEAVPYKCRLCAPIKTFTKFFDIFQHTNMEHLGCCYQCPQCPNKKFIERIKFENHMTTHSDAKSHICNVCGSALKSLPSLRRHLKVYHSEGGIKMHICEFCAREFTLRSNMKAHMKREHGEDGRKEVVPRKPRGSNSIKSNRASSSIAKNRVKK